MILSVRSQRDLQVASIEFSETEMAVQQVNIMFQLQALEVNVMTGGNCHVMSEHRVTIVCEMSLIITLSLEREGELPSHNMTSHGFYCRQREECLLFALGALLQ